LRWCAAGGPGAAFVYAPEGRTAARWAAGSRLISLKIDRSAVADALSDALGRQVTSQLDLRPVMSTHVAPTRSWINMVMSFQGAVLSARQRAPATDGRIAIRRQPGARVFARR
jgi:hypothetical protein